MALEILKFKKEPEKKYNKSKKGRTNNVLNTVKKNRLKKTGWPNERYVIFLYAQGGICYLCGESNYSQGINFALSADHNHTTGQMRMLLCHPCNTLLGRIENKYSVFTLLNYLDL